jgi:hypothetical protein
MTMPGWLDTAALISMAIAVSVLIGALIAEVALWIKD